MHRVKPGEQPAAQGIFTPERNACMFHKRIISLRRRVRVGRAHWDERIIFRGRIERAHDFQHRSHDPSVDGGFLLTRVSVEIVDARNPEFHRRIEHRVLPEEVHLPVAPLHGGQAIRAPDGETLAGRLLGFAEEEIRLIDVGNRLLPCRSNPISPP